MKLGRMPLIIGVAAGTLMALPGGAAAEPRPTVQQAKARLTELNDRADKVVDRYNKANEEYKSAKARYGKLNERYRAKLATVAGLRDEVVSMAVDSYQTGGGLTAASVMLNESDPTGTLGGMALADQLAAERAQQLDRFLQENQGLKARRDEAQRALDDSNASRKKAAGERTEILKLVKKQKALLDRLGTYRAGDPNSPGKVYSGSATGNAAAVLSFAYAQIGKPYQWGGAGPNGWDCSGLTQAAWRAGGVTLPRTTWEQWNWGVSTGRKVSMSDLRPGDLIFSEGLGHVSIYAGNGKVVHAPHTGDVVKVASLSDTVRQLVGAIRP